MSVRGKEKVINELGFALMAVNLRKYTAKMGKSSLGNGNDFKKLVPSNFQSLRTSFLLLSG